MKVQVIEDASILVPNTDHRNFTDSGHVIPANSIIYGEEKFINGLRRGEPFTYKLFVTDKNELIYLKKIKPMENTEVLLNADGQVSATKVNLKNPEISKELRMSGIAIGAIGGYLYSRKKTQKNEKTIMYIVAGAAIGYAAAYVLNYGNNILIEKSK